MQFTDRIPFDAVARTIDGFDVCLMPHRDNSLSRSMSPLKLFQYVARGKPVVSTPVAGLETVADLIRVAPATGPFLDAITSALETEVGDPVLRRQPDRTGGGADVARTRSHDVARHFPVGHAG